MSAISRSVFRKKNRPNIRRAADARVETASAPKSQGRPRIDARVGGDDPVHRVQRRRVLEPTGGDYPSV